MFLTRILIIPVWDVNLPDMKKTIISSKGQIVIPADFSNQDKNEADQAYNIERVDKGEYRLVVAEPLKNLRLIDTLLTCPVKAWFVPIESECSSQRGCSPL